MIIMEFYQFCPLIVPNLYLTGHHQEISGNLESLHFPQNFTNAKKKNGHGKMVMENFKNGHGKVIEKSMWEPCLHRYYKVLLRFSIHNRPPLIKKLFPVYRPSGLNRADWIFFSMFFLKKVCIS